MPSLIDHATSERTAYEAAASNAQAKLSAAQRAYKLAESGAAARAKTLAEHEALMAQTRAAKEAATIPADAAALLATLTTQAIELRRLQGRLRDDRDEVAATGAELAFATRRLERLQTRLKETEKGFDAEKEAHKRRQTWQQSLGLAPLATLKQDAADLRAGAGSTLLADARARFTTAPTAVPGKLLELARRRHALWRRPAQRAQDALEAAEDALGARLAADNDELGKARQAGIDFRQAERRLGDYVANAKARYDKAVGLLTALASLSTALSAAEAAQANEAALLSDREDAADDELAIFTPQENHDAGLAEVENTVLAAQAEDINDSTPSDAGGPYDTAVAALPALKTALDAANGALDPAERDRLADWQVRLSDRTWQRILDLVEAEAELKWLEDTDPTTLRTNLATAENGYATALSTAADNRRAAEYLEDAIELRQAQATWALEALPARLFSAVRGDAN